MSPDPIAELIYEQVLEHTVDLPDDLPVGAERAAEAIRARYFVVNPSVEPCGANLVVEWDHGLEAVVRWCSRREGPCPFPGATPAGGSRPCAATR